MNKLTHNVSSSIQTDVMATYSRENSVLSKVKNAFTHTKPEVTRASLNGGVDEASQRKASAYSQKAAKLYAERDAMILGMGRSQLEANSLMQQQKSLSNQMGREKLAERVAVEQKKIGMDDKMVDILSDSKAFINHMENQDAQTYAALSALAYEQFETGSFKRSQIETSVDLGINTKQQQLENLATYGSKLSDLIKNTSPSKLESEIKEFAKGLKTVFGIEVPGMHQEDLVTAIEGRKHTLKNEINELKEQTEIEQSVQIKQLQKLLSQNKFARNLEVKGIFYRNDGEFSGFAAYNKDTHQLQMIFAGSKSTGDWVKNAMGWNGKASPRRGLLAGMNLHAGFLSHLESLSDSAFESAYRIIEQLSKRHPEKSLKIVGTGHSLGGALATLFTACAKEMADSMGLKNVEARGCTFGAPNMVHGASVERLNTLFGGAGNWVRFENSKDPVPVACFWKDNPGVSIRFNADFFYDVSGALQMFGQNPHGVANYSECAGVHMSKWKEQVAGLQKLLNQQQVHKNQLATWKKQADGHLQSIQQNLIKLIDFDRKHDAQLAEAKLPHLAELKAKVKVCKLNFENFEQQLTQDALAHSQMEDMAKCAKQLAEDLKLHQLVYEDALKIDHDKLAKASKKERLKKLQNLLKPTCLSV